ncbi:MAG: hypothetical protein HRU15_17365 [Planctomycetes bacterium]|nr:hypothetical protein [Planctomycetota bacterium]
MAGREHDAYVALLKEKSNFTDFPAYDKTLYEKILSDASCFIIPGVAQAGPFPFAKSRIIDGDQEVSLSDAQKNGMNSEHFADSNYMYGVLNITLAMISHANFKNVGLDDGLRIYIEGGFRKNTPYHNLLAALCPSNDLVLSNLEEATAFGAALMNTAAIRGCDLREVNDIFELKTDAIGKHSFTGLDAYYEKFLEHVARI